jgi:CTD small phosphatase-like protein 2
VDDWEKDNPDIELQISFPSGDVCTAGINLRPHLKECLIEANKHFQVIVFTASHQSYADVILDHIDPEHKLFQYRVYRESWVAVDKNVYIKDLGIFKNRQLNNLLIIDNAVHSFGFHLDNGIPIVPFYDDPTDDELQHLITYLKCLKSQLKFDK